MSLAAGAGSASNAGIFGFSYNRANYKFDQTQRWARYNAGRKMAVAQVGLFRQDCADLAAVAINKMKVYAPILTMSLGYCITIFVEGRSGLKFPGPPVFVSGLYFQCLGVAFGFMTLATWLVFHSAIRAQVASTQLRTRKVRLPVPTQRQLDGARKLMSTFEENGVYDIFKLPFVMPNSGNTPGTGDAPGMGTQTPCPGEAAKGPAKAGKPGSKKSKAKGGRGEADFAAPAEGVRMPGVTSGAPSWVEKEMDGREEHPKSSPSGHGLEGPAEPFEHFELIRQAQKEWWSAEAYSRVCFLFGMMHLIQSFGYWLVLHCIAELAMVWCANVCAAGLSAGVWLMFRLDVLPDHGGCFPVEASGPFVASVALSLMYTAHPTQQIVDWARAVAILCLAMQIMWILRLWVVAKPTNTQTPGKARESGGRLFNESGACELPSWLPAAMQHCTYLVAPPKSKQQLEREARAALPGERPSDIESEGVLRDDPMTKVDMTPWYYTRVMLIASIVGWSILLTGRIVELTMGERMLVTNPGSPPWTRTGQWYGWEHGPISSKHYAHVTPQRGHWAWQKGWGPQGQQELWASDMFGFAPEADAWWSEGSGPEPRIGAAGIGENTWAHGLIAYGTNERPHGSTGGEHDFLDSGGHRRLQAAESQVRPVVPVALRWPVLLEPDLLACGPSSAQGGAILALTASGLGALVPLEVATGKASGEAAAVSLTGLTEHGLALGVTWGNGSLLVATGSGAVARCPMADLGAGRAHCSALGVPRLPLEHASIGVGAAATVLHGPPGSPLRAAVARAGGRVRLLELHWPSGSEGVWDSVAEVNLPSDGDSGEAPEVVAVAADLGHLLVTTGSGATYRWELREHRPIWGPGHEVPAAGGRRAWRSACTMPGGKILRLASNWRRSAGRALAWHPELLL